MFQNAAIDVAIGLILMHLMLSLLCTVVNEFIATKLELRFHAEGCAAEADRRTSSPDQVTRADRLKFSRRGDRIANNI